MLSRKANSPVLAILGPGRVGCSLGRLLRARGWCIGAVVGRSRAKAHAAVRAIGAGTPCVGFSPEVLAAGVVLVTTPDDAMARSARDLAGFGGDWHGKVVLHTSGALDRSVLRDLERCGAATGSLHPLQTFSGRGDPPLAGRVCAIEGTAVALRMARRICRDLSCLPVIVPRRAKPAYHAAAALAAGHVLGVVETAVRILVKAGFSRPQAVRALLPLTRQTLLNFERFGPARAWTGPASRGDWETVERHLESLRGFPREYRAAYAALTRLSVRVLSPGRGGKARRRAQIPAGV